MFFLNYKAIYLYIIDNFKLKIFLKKIIFSKNSLVKILILEINDIIYFKIYFFEI